MDPNEVAENNHLVMRMSSLIQKLRRVQSRLEHVKRLWWDAVELSHYCREQFTGVRRGVQGSDFYQLGEKTASCVLKKTNTNKAWEVNRDREKEPRDGTLSL